MNLMRMCLQEMDDSLPVPDHTVFDRNQVIGYAVGQLCWHCLLVAYALSVCTMSCGFLKAIEAASMVPVTLCKGLIE